MQEQDRRDAMENSQVGWNGRLSLLVVTKWWFQTCFIFTPTWGEKIQFDEHIVQSGRNHQLGEQRLGRWCLVLFPSILIEYVRRTSGMFLMFQNQLAVSNIIANTNKSWNIMGFFENDRTRTHQQFA